MKYDLNRDLIIDDKPVIEEGEKITYKDLIKKAITANTADNEKLPGEKKYELYKLAMKIDNDEELTIDEVAIIKTHSGKVYPIKVVGVLWDFLEDK